MIGAIGVLGMVPPERLISFARTWQTPTWLYVAALPRIVLRLLLFLAAPDSRAPGVLRILGVIIFVGGLVTPFFGQGKGNEIIEVYLKEGYV